MSSLQRWGSVLTTFVYSCALFGLLYSSARSVSMTLVFSGVVEREADALQFSFVPFGLALVLKAFAGWLGEGARKRYLGILTFVVVALALTWTLMFVSTYGDTSQIELSGWPNGCVDDTADYTQALLAVGLIAQSCMAALIWLAIERIAGRYHDAEPRLTEEVLDVASN